MYPELWTMPGFEWTLKSYGFMMMVGFLSGVYLAMRRCMKVKCDPDALLNVAFIALISGVIGARAFFVIHYWDEGFADLPNKWFAVINITQGGLEFLGGVIPAIFVVALYIKLKGWSIRLYADVVAIILPWALAFGRVGCFLNGCCFGGVCVDDHRHATTPLAVQFPFGSPAAIRQWEERQNTYPAELIADNFRITGKDLLWEASTIGRELLSMSPEKREKPIRRLEQLRESYAFARSDDPEGKATKKLAEQIEKQEQTVKYLKIQLLALDEARHYPSREDPQRGMTYSEVQALAIGNPALWVHPTQLYAAIGGFLLAALLGRVFHRRKRHGLVFGLFLMLYPLQRLPLEVIRADNPLDTFGLTVSQGISLAMIAAGAIWVFVIYRFMPERSPLAVPWVPPEPEGEPTPA